MTDNNDVLCSLCDNKRFKNSQGLKIHQRVHYSKNIHISSEFFSCSLCPNTKYKKKVDGVVMKPLNTLTTIYLLEIFLSFLMIILMKTLVYFIQSGLKLHAKHARICCGGW